MSTLLERHTMADPSGSPSAANEPCYLLEKLPAELRNNIYELAFTSDDEIISYDAEDRPDYIDLCTATPPSKNLILTCREIYQEANKMYKSMYRDYWTENSFMVDETKRKPDRAALEALREEDLIHIDLLEITTWGSDKEWDNTDILAENGGWMDGSWEKQGNEWETHNTYRFLYKVNPYSRVGAKYIACECVETEEEWEALDGSRGHEVPLKYQLLWNAMVNYEENERDLLKLAANDDSWRGRYCEELPLAGPNSGSS